MGIGKNYSKTQLYWLNSIIGIMNNTYSTFEKKYLPYSDTYHNFYNDKNIFEHSLLLHT